jgi:hypothetical protein
MKSKLALIIVVAEISLAGLAHAQRLPTAAAQPQARPWNMPCRILQRLGSVPNISKVYALHFNSSGQLVVATSRKVLNQCITLSACQLDPSDTTELEYQYDEEGRLSEAFSPTTNEQFNVTYQMGRPVSYNQAASPTNLAPLGSTTTIRTGASWRPETSILRMRVGKMRLRALSQFSGGQESFIAKPVVWPYAHKFLYLGWEIKVTQFAFFGISKDTAYETETVTFDKNGRIDKVAILMSDHGLSTAEREFVYECPNDRPTE